MKNWSIRKKIQASFALILVLMVAMGLFAFSRMEVIEEELTNVNGDSMLGIRDGSQLEAAWFDNFVLTQQSLLQKDRADLKKVEEALKANQANLDSLIARYDTHVGDQVDLGLLKAVKSGRATYSRIQDEVLALNAAAKSNEARTLLVSELTPAFQKVRTTIPSMVSTNLTDIDNAHRQILHSAVLARVGISIVQLVAIVMAFVCGYLLLRTVTQPLARLLEVLDVVRKGDFTSRMNVAQRDEFGTLAEGFNRMCDELVAIVTQVQQSGMQVTSSVTEVAATAKQQQATAGEIAATTSEIGATSKEIWVTSKELVNTMNEVSAVAEQSATLAGNGQENLAQMEETMRRVMEAAGAINAKLSVLNEKASNISQVVTTITKVADQTNLLSLNAAIEAEKAGEHGRGFSVVAVEIRRLADQTAVATYDIEQMVKEIQSAVAAGVMGMDKFSEEVRRGMQEVQHVGSQLTQIIQQVQTLAPRFESVNEGMQAQATGAEQISEALMQLSEATQQTADSLRQSNTAIEDLHQVANTLLGGVSRFKLQTQT